MSKIIIATWMYSAPVDEVSLHHQVGASIGKQKVKNIYWRCCANLFRSAYITNPDAILYLFCNEMPPEIIDGQNFIELLASFGVEIKILENITRPPAGFYGAWSTQFIVLDVLAALNRLSSKEDSVLILDSDCLITKEFSSRFVDKLKKHKALLYTLDGAWETNNNGITNRELSDLSQSYQPAPVKQDVFYTGGEFICVMGSEIQSIVELGYSAFKQSLDKTIANENKFNEEAHLLSYVYAVKGYADYTGNEFIRRIWTDPFTRRTCYRDESDLLIWHLPAEKKTSMKSLYSLGDKANELMLDKKKFAQFVNVEISPLFWVKFSLRAMARMVVRLKRKVL